MQIVFMLLLGMMFLNNMYAMKQDEEKHQKGQLIIQDIEKLKPYYTAIQKIRVTLEEAASKFNYRTGFVGWPEPNPFYWRTPKYIFLETSIIQETETLCALYTPFGEVKLLSGGLYTEMKEVSKDFLKNMQWKLKDVTNQIHIYNYVQEKNKLFGPHSFKKEQWEGAGDTSKLYLVVSVDSTEFHEENSQEKLITLGSIICLANGQYEKDKKQFKELSNSKCSF